MEIKVIYIMAGERLITRLRLRLRLRRGPCAICGVINLIGRLAVPRGTERHVSVFIYLYCTLHLMRLLLVYFKSEIPSVQNLSSCRYHKI